MLTVTKPDDKKTQDFRVTHEGTDLFVVEEALAISHGCLALMDEVMTAAFNPKRKTDSIGSLLPFGGKKMLFLDDQAQLSPIGSAAVYDDGRHNIRHQREKQNCRKERKLVSCFLRDISYRIASICKEDRGAADCWARSATE